MVRNICFSQTAAKILSISGRRQYATVAAVANVEKIRKSPFITCKNTGFNIYFDQIADTSTKFGSIPLASNGWKHRKAKGDFFVIHPTAEEDVAFSRLTNVEDLKQDGINEEIIKNLNTELEVEKLTEIQSNAILKVKDMNHVLIAAETGCGKTLAYLIPIIQEILNEKPRLEKRKMNTPLALVLTPGRELAAQIGSVIEKLCKNLDVKIKVVLGGNTKQKMVNPEFENIDILVGTIGAISKLVTAGIYRMNEMRHVVLDEADTLLDDSFSNKLSHFLKKFPFHKNHLHDLKDNIRGTQLIMASATMPVNIEEQLSNIVNTEMIHEVVSPNLHRLMPHIQQKFLRMNKSERPGQLLSIVKMELKKKRPMIVFGNKSATSDFISLFLNEHGVNCINLNGDMQMKIRVGRFEKFQNGEVDVLATTDVGSRGLDTTRAKHVINFDFPLHVADYIHRCGRIGRLGSYHKCLVTNFVSSVREIDVVQKIEHSARTGGLLPNVNANITNLIHKRILKEIELDNQEVERRIF